jgi:hypothetical protein
MLQIVPVKVKFDQNFTKGSKDAVLKFFITQSDSASKLKHLASAHLRFWFHINTSIGRMGH